MGREGRAGKDQNREKAIEKEKTQEIKARQRKKTTNGELKTKTIGKGLAAYPYDSSSTIKTILQSN